MEDWQRDSSEACFRALVTNIILKPMLTVMIKGSLQTITLPQCTGICEKSGQAI